MKITLFLFFFFLFESAFSSPHEFSKQNDSNSDIVAVGDSAYRVFNYDYAISVYESARLKSPSASVLIKLADAYFFGGYQKSKREQESMYLKARESLFDALKEKSLNTDGLAEIYARLGQVTGQLALLRGSEEKVKLGLEIKQYADKALELNANNAMANAVIGIWHYELAQLGFFERTAANLFFGNVPKGKMEFAESYLAKAVKENPNVIYYHNAYAKVLLKLGKEEEAKTQLEIALKLPFIVAGDKQNKSESKDLLSQI